MNQTELLFKVTENVEFFRDVNDKEIFYAEFENNNGKREFALLDSEAFKSFLYVKSCVLTDGEKALEPDSAVKRIRFFLNYHKNFEDVNVFVRTSGNLAKGLEYDLQNDAQKTVKITTGGWEISAKKHRFIVPDISLPQVIPIETNRSSLELLKPFVNIRGDDYLLFVIWLVQAFSRSSHYAPLIFAEKGCGKTSMSKFIKRIIYPCNFKVTPIPDKKEDLQVLLYNSFLCCFDNVSAISNDASDTFCGAITGTSVAKRSLYTNGKLTVCTLHNTIVINGIGVVPSRDDLQERMLLFRLEKIASNKRVTESKLWQMFDEALPEILGSIFNTLSVAMQKMRTLQTNDIARIGDAFVEMLAIAQALGISEEKFRQIFNDNKEALKKACSTSPLIEAVKETMASLQGRKLQGSANTVFQTVYKNYSGDKTALPQSASHFTRQLDKEYESLIKNGLRVNIDDTGAQGTQVAIIKRK